MEIIQKPTELKVLVNKAPVIGGQPSKNNSKKGWKQIQQEMIENTLSLEGSESRRGDDDVDNNEMSGGGDSTSKALVDFQSDQQVARLVDWDDSSHNQGRIRQSRQINPFYTSDGGLGILLSLLVVAFVLLVITFVVLRRSFCLDDEIPSILSDSVQLEKPDPATIKEVRIKLGKHKSVENRKVLRELSADQGAKTMEEEIVIARSVISPSMETRMRESESLRTRAKIRSATSQSGRKASFQEDLKEARCEFVASHVRYAKLVTLTADDDAHDSSADKNNKDSNKPAKSDEF